MSLPTACTSRRRPFSRADHHRRLSLLDGPIALCGDCSYRVDHPEEMPVRCPVTWTGRADERRIAA